MQTTVDAENELRRTDAQKSFGRHLIGSVTASAVFSSSTIALLLLL